MATTNYIIFFGLFLFAIFGELYISPSDASQTPDEITNVKTSIEKLVDYYSESPAYVYNGRYSREFDAKLIAQKGQSPIISQQNRKVNEIQDEWFDGNERNIECLRNPRNALCDYDQSPIISQHNNRVKEIQDEWFDRNERNTECLRNPQNALCDYGQSPIIYQKNLKIKEIQDEWFDLNR